MPKIGDVIEVKVVKVLPVGAILTANDSFDYFLHIKDAKTKSSGYIKHMSDIVTVGETIKARITSSKKHKGKISFQLSLSLLDDDKYKKEVFESKMRDYLKTSEDTLKQVRQNRERKQNNGKRNKRIK